MSEPTEKTLLRAPEFLADELCSFRLGKCGVLVLLMLLNIMNYCDRNLLTSFANFIMPDLGLTTSQLGLLTGFAFTTIYSFMGLICGGIADAVHRPLLIAVGIGLWSLLTGASGFAQGFVGAAGTF